MIRRVFRPLELQVSGRTDFGDFTLGLELFGGRKELFADIANDIHSPLESTGCEPASGVAPCGIRHPGPGFPVSRT